MKAKVLLAVMAAALLLAACQSPAATDKKAEKKDPEARTEEKKEEFGNYGADALNGIQTNTNTIFDQAELTVVNIWDLSCDSCKGEMEALGEIGREYAGKGVQILGIVRGVNADNESEAEAAAAEVNADYVQMIASEEMEKNVLSKYGDAPVTVMVGRDGTVLGDAYAGAKDKEYWNTEIEKYHSKVCVNDHPADCGVG